MTIVLIASMQMKGHDVTPTAFQANGCDSDVYVCYRGVLILYILFLIPLVTIHFQNTLVCEDPSTHGSIFIPITIGMDKTMSLPAIKSSILFMAAS